MVDKYLYHNGGYNACNGKAYIWNKEELPEVGGVLISSDLLCLDSSDVKALSIPVCCSCGLQMNISLIKSKDVK